MQAQAGNPDVVVESDSRILFASMLKAAPWLTLSTLFFTIDLLFCLAGLATDRSTVTGMPTWAKPLKFAISTGLFTANLAYLLTYLTRWRRVIVVLEKVLAFCLTLEILLINLQAARHLPSHFNVATPFDGMVYGMMGIGISVVMAGTTLLLILGLLDPCKTRIWAWTIRLSLVLVLAGMSTGALMTLPTPEQLQAAHQAGHAITVGRHTVGGPDGGVGLPLTGWSADHGDLRIAHFVGLHGMQVLTFGALLAIRRKRWIGSRGLRFILGIAISIASLFAIVLSEALRGLSILRGDLTTWGAFLTWLLVTGFLLYWSYTSAEQLPVLKRTVRQGELG